MKKGIKLLFLLPMLLTGCEEQTYDDSFKHFCDYYNSDYVSAYIETTTEHDVHEIRTTSKTFMAHSIFEREGHNFLYAKLDVLYLTDEHFHSLKWLVEYEYSKDYSYENVVCYSNVEVVR